jgi:aspartokinase
VGAVSAIGAGIKATPRNLRRAVGVLRPLETPLLGVSTSSFRISILLAEARLDEAVRALHRALIETEPAPAEA